ncbi:MAG: twin-arginine translocase TatA/TatE family subunit [Bacteroidota bacterium]
MTSTLLFLNMGGSEMILIVLVIIIFFGSKSIPGIAQGLGKGIREFKDAASGIQREIEDSATKIKDDIGVEKIKQDLDVSKGIKDNLDLKE